MSDSRILPSTRCALFTYSLGVLHASYCWSRPGFIEGVLWAGMTCVLQVPWEWAEQKSLPSRSTCPQSPIPYLGLQDSPDPSGRNALWRFWYCHVDFLWEPAVLTCRRVKAPAPQGGWICFNPGSLLAQLVSYYLLSHPCCLSSITLKSSCDSILLLESERAFSHHCFGPRTSAQQPAGAAQPGSRPLLGAPSFWKAGVTITHC